MDKESFDNLPEPAVRLARNSYGREIHDSNSRIDVAKLLEYRLGRVREVMRARDIGGLVIYDPINLRYATGLSAQMVFSMHFPDRYCFLPIEGPVVMFEKANWIHLTENQGIAHETRPSIQLRWVVAGQEAETNVSRWVNQITDLLERYGAGSKRLAVDRCEPPATLALAEKGIELADAQTVMELARGIKSDEEIACMNISIAVAETGMARMLSALTPGMTENELWAILAHTNTAMGGEWIECRQLVSGGRANPWMQEATDRIIRAGELVVFDTNMIGPFGYIADISRVFFCDPGHPSRQQRHLYSLAFEELHHNLSLVKPGMSAREFAEGAWKVPEEFRPNSYAYLAHGVGLCDEWPNFYRTDRLETHGEADLVLQPGMALSVESYIGEVGGTEGVKLEQQILVTDEGYELLSTFPFEDRLLT